MSEINKNMPFDSAREDVEDPDTIDGNENVIEWLNGNDTATVQLAGHRKLNNKVHEWAKEYPEEVQIVGENTNGSIVAYIPASYITLRRPVHRELSDEQREELRERLKKVRDERK